MSAVDTDEPESEATGGSDTGLRTRVLTALKIVVAIALLAWVARSVDWAAIRENVVGIEPWVLGVVLLATSLEFLTRIGAWQVLLAPVGPRSFRTAAEVDLSIKFINHVVPSKAAGHAVAPLVLRHFADLEWSDAVGVAGSNTALYSILYGVAALVGLAIFAVSLPPWLVVVLLGSIGVYVLAAGAIVLTGFGLGDTLGQRALTVARRIPVAAGLLSTTTGALPEIAGDARRSFRAIVSRPGTLAQFALAWAGTFMIGAAVRVGLLLAAFGAPFEPFYLLPFVLVMAYSVTVLPITPGGVGVAEASALTVFVALGVPEAAIAPAIVLDRFLGVYLPALLGWVPMLDVDLGRVLDAEAVPGDGE